MDTECIFCKIANKEIDASLIYEDEKIVAFSDLNPQAPVHLLFIPKKHISSMNDMQEEDAELLSHLFLKIKEVAKQKAIADGGYRIVTNCNKDGGQEVFHLHVHLLGGRKLTWPPG